MTWPIALVIIFGSLIFFTFMFFTIVYLKELAREEKIIQDYNNNLKLVDMPVLLLDKTKTKKSAPQVAIPDDKSKKNIN